MLFASVGHAALDPVHDSATSQTPAAPRHCIGSIGRYEERKGHETLIRAMAIVLKEFPDARLMVAGHDPWGYGGVLQRLIDEMDLRDHIQLIGFMSDKESFFSQIDIFAFASLSTQAYEMQRLAASFAAPRYRVEFEATLAASPAAVMAVLTRYADYPALDPRIRLA